MFPNRVKWLHPVWKFPPGVMLSSPVNLSEISIPRSDCGLSRHRGVFLCREHRRSHVSNISQSCSKSSKLNVTRFWIKHFLGRSTKRIGGRWWCQDVFGTSRSINGGMAWTDKLLLGRSSWINSMEQGKDHWSITENKCLCYSTTIVSIISSSLRVHCSLKSVKHQKNLGASFRVCMARQAVCLERLNYPNTKSGVARLWGAQRMTTLHYLPLKGFVVCPAVAMHFTVPLFDSDVRY